VRQHAILFSHLGLKSYCCFRSTWNASYGMV